MCQDQWGLDPLSLPAPRRILYMGLTPYRLGWVYNGRVPERGVGRLNDCLVQPMTARRRRRRSLQNGEVNPWHRTPIIESSEQPGSAWGLASTPPIRRMNGNTETGRRIGRSAGGGLDHQGLAR